MAPVQYGPRISALILYLYVGLFLSKKPTAQALAELFGTPVSEGTVATMTRRAAESLDDFLGQVAERITAAEVTGSTRPDCVWRGALAWGALRADQQVHPAQVRRAW